MKITRMNERVVELGLFEFGQTPMLNGSLNDSCTSIALSGMIRPVTVLMKIVMGVRMKAFKRKMTNVVKAVAWRLVDAMCERLPQMCDRQHQQIRI